MLDETKEVVQEVQETEVASSEQEQQQPAAAVEVPKETAQARNFRELKTQAEKIARERDEALKYIKQIQEQQQAPKVAPSPVSAVADSDDDDVRLGDDELAEGKHLTKMGRKLKAMKAELEEVKRQSINMAQSVRIKAEMPDFEKVCTKENISALELAYPQIASAINPNADVYTQSKAIYDLIKGFGIDSSNSSREAERELIKTNLSKPKPGVSVAAQQGGLSPMARASDHYSGELTDEMKKAFYRELQEAKMNRR